MAMLITLLSWTDAPAARADGAAIPEPPSTVSTDPLPTPQINGVVWDQVIVGNTVYVAGNFTKARPFGAAPGTNEVDRPYMLSYDLTTGALLPWAPAFNAQVRAITASPDGTRLYAAGDFTTVNGVAKSRIVAFSTATGAMDNAFSPRANYRVYAVVATDSTVYFAGPFSSVSGNTRLGAAAALASNGALTAWAPELAGGRAYGIVVSPGGDKVVIGGDFTTVNGSGNPGYGLAMVDTSEGELITPFTANAVVRNGGVDAAIFSLDSDSDSFYGSGYVFGNGGNLEGTFRANWSDGSISWVNDCHGDTYSVSAAPNGAVYAAGHAHYCGNIDSFPQTEPWGFSRGMAFSKEPGVSISRDPYGYHNFSGNSGPAVLNFFPTISLGTFTGQFQGPWDVSSSAEYAVFGGEFTRVNNVPQQGLVRFAVDTIAPNLDGPRLTGNDLVPTMTAPASGTVALSWPANWDRDDETLTYHLIRDGRSASPIHVVEQDSRFYDRPTMTYVDTGLTPGQTYTYRLRAIDPHGNSAWGATVSFAAGSSGELSEYARTVMDDQPTNYWRLGDTNGSTAADSVSRDRASANAGVSFGASGAIVGDDNSAATFTGGSNSFTAQESAQWRDNSFSVEAWFKTSTTAGGKIIGFGDRRAGNSSNYDRHIYMDNSGRVNFGVYTGSSKVLQSAKPYNDDQWHHVVGSMGPGGMELYVDGVRIGADPTTTWGQNYYGYWRIGGDNSWSGANYFAGAIDEVAVYPQPLTANQVQDHYLLSGREAAGPGTPADAYGTAVYGQSPQLYWRLDEAAGTQVNDSGPQGIPGAITGTYARGVAGALGGVENTATRFTQGLAVSTTSIPNPSVFTSEVWFRTTTTVGGKLTGFGSAAAGNSGNVGDHLIMRDDGTLLFGTSTSTVSTTEAFNDGDWHHAVATQGPAGQRLYVDGELRRSSAATPSQTFSGFWRLGRDATGGASSSVFFDGDLDEFAVYPTVASAQEVSVRYQLGIANEAPTAAFSHAAADLAVTFDAGASTDGDGSVTDYAWDFGDGATGSGIAPEHVYADAGSYDVSLTVTDDRGATSTTIQAVTVEMANVAPLAVFSAEVTGNVVDVDGTSSTDADGSIASYLWDFGDGATATAASASHAYEAAGVYTVTLTVTDDRGATATTSRDVTVDEPPTTSVIAADAFARAAGAGWGAADLGGTWSPNAPTAFSIASDGGIVTHAATATTRRARLQAVSSDDVTVSASIAVDKPITGGGVYAGLIVREVGSDYYQARVRYFSTGAISLQLLDGGSTIISSANIPGVTVVPGDVLLLRAQAYGTSPTTIRAKVWKAGTAEPDDWSVEATSSSAGLQAAGAVGVQSYLSGSMTNTPVRIRYDDFSAVSGHADTTEPVPEPVPNTSPTASFTRSIDALSVAFDSTASSDEDGLIVSRSWSFGDGQTSSGANPVHTYAAAGTYSVTLTVTDDEGATHDATQEVTVAAVAEEVAPVAAFTVAIDGLAVAADASGSGDADGSVASYAWSFGDGQTASGIAPTHTYAAPGSYAVELVVTDDDGLTGVSRQEIVVGEAPALLAQDDFERAGAAGWGAGIAGGQWSASPNTAFRVENGSGLVTHAAAGTLRRALLPGVSQSGVELQVALGADKAVEAGSLFVGVVGRQVGTSYYQTRARLMPGGVVGLQILSGSSTVIGNMTVAGLTYAPGDQLLLKTSVSGVSPTTISAKLWRAGAVEPAAWQLTVTDSTAALQAAGSIGIESYISASAPNVPITTRFDDFIARPLP